MEGRRQVVKKLMESERREQHRLSAEECINREPFSAPRSSSFAQLHTVLTLLFCPPSLSSFLFWLGLLLTIARTHPLLPFFNINKLAVKNMYRSEGIS